MVVNYYYSADPTAPGDPNSPWRNRPIEESLKEFINMKNGNGSYFHYHRHHLYHD